MLANMIEGGKSPVQDARELGERGFRIVIFPGGTARFVAAQIRRYFDSLRQHETTAPMLESMLDFDGLNEVIGTPELMALGQRYAG
jgi:2-methylisocitrate lyase-like PEP mutase family enzyme